MKRLWVLLLICLFPVQVFAAVLTYASSVAATDFTEPAISMVAKLANASDAVSAAVDNDTHHDAVADNSSSSDDENSGYADSSEDFSTHAGIGDEPVLIQSLAVLPDQTSLAPALRSDNASQPPFLPLAGRPPRV